MLISMKAHAGVQGEREREDFFEFLRGFYQGFRQGISWEGDRVLNSEYSVTLLSCVVADDMISF